MNLYIFESGLHPEFFPSFLKCYEFNEEAAVVQSGISLVLLQSASAVPQEQTACSTDISSRMKC